MELNEKNIPQEFFSYARLLNDSCIGLESVTFKDGNIKVTRNISDEKLRNKRVTQEFKLNKYPKSNYEKILNQLKVCFNNGSNIFNLL